MLIRYLHGSKGAHSVTAPAQKLLAILWVISAAIAGTLILLLATSRGIGLSPDSAGYVAYARNLLDGQGVRALFETRVTQWPPLYPVLLSTSGLFGTDPLNGARFLHALLFASNILLAGFLLYKHSGLLWVAGVGTLLFVSSRAMLLIHFFAWSEPLFILLMLLGMIVLERYMESGRRLNLVTAALIVGLACLTRYIGITLISTVVLALLFFRRSSFRQKMIDAFIFGLFSILPLALWFLRNLFVVGSTSGREIAFHPATLEHFWHVMYTVTSWLHIADMTPGFIWIGVWFAVFIGAVGVLWSRRQKQHGVGNKTRLIPPMIRLQALFIVNYGLFLVFSISFVDANTPLDDRILAPVFVSGLILAMFLVGEAIRLVGDRRKTAASVAVAVPLALLAIANTAQGISRVATSRAEGLGYATPRWQQSPLVAEVKSLPADTVIFSNAPEVIALFADRPATRLPRHFSKMAQAENADYEAEVAEVKKTVQEREGVIVFFSGLDRPVMTIEELHGRLSLRPLTVVADGAIYGAGNRK